MNRAELRELADTYFTRFSALLDERIAASEARQETKWDARLNERLAASETKFEARLDQRIGTVQLELARLEGKLDAAIAGLIIALAKAWL